MALVIAFFFVIFVLLFIFFNSNYVRGWSWIIFRKNYLNYLSEYTLDLFTIIVTIGNNFQTDFFKQLRVKTINTASATVFTTASPELNGALFICMKGELEKF